MKEKKNWKTECIHDGIQVSDLRRVGFPTYWSVRVKYGLVIVIALAVMVLSFAYWASFIY